jgi:hypothetical protein
VTVDVLALEIVGRGRQQLHDDCALKMEMAGSSVVNVSLRSMQLTFF